MTNADRPHSRDAGSSPALQDAVRRALPSVRADLDALVRIPSVSPDPAHASDVLRSARAVADLARRAGAADVEVLAVEGGRPAVVARWPGPAGAPTVLLYAHHDVQPVTGQAWASEPFEPVERSGRLFARGAADDKAGIAAHLAALRAFDGRPPVGVVLLVEGEEEVGSPTFVQFLETHRDRLAADVIVVADSANWTTEVPALTTSLRGLVDCEVEVATLDHLIHSGMWGGAAPDAMMALVRLLASLHAGDGSVAVDGLTSSDDVDVDYAEADLRADAGVLEGVELIGSGPLAARLWVKPSLTVLGVDGPRPDEAGNVMQARARAKLSLRIPPGQDPAAALAALKAHLAAHVPFGARLTVHDGGLGNAISLPAGGAAHEAARDALREAWEGTEPVNIGLGGSIPFIAEFQRLFPDASVLVTGVEDPDSRAHGGDESLDLTMFARACLAEAFLLRNLASLPAAGS